MNTLKRVANKSAMLAPIKPVLEAECIDDLSEGVVDNAVNCIIELLWDDSTRRTWELTENTTLASISGDLEELLHTIED